MIEDVNIYPKEILSQNPYTAAMRFRAEGLAKETRPNRQHRVAHVPINMIV